MTLPATGHARATFTGVNTRAHLVATPITDVTGKQTTVYRRPVGGPAALRSMPAPAVAAAAAERSTPERTAYRQRLAAIAEANRVWERDSVCEGLDQLKMGALEALSALMVSVATHAGDGHGGEEAGEFAQLAVSTTSTMEYGRLIAANALAPLYHAFEADHRLDPTDADAREEASENDFYGWDPVHLFAIVCVVERLQRLGLQARHDVPASPSDDRLCAHLWASARRVIDYNGIHEGHDEIIRLIDEHPTDVEAIAAGFERGLHPEAVRAVIEGNAAPAVAAGIL